MRLTVCHGFYVEAKLCLVFPKTRRKTITELPFVALLSLLYINEEPTVELYISEWRYEIRKNIR